MLIQFSFKNFKVFKEEVLLDFLPASINEHKNTLLKDPADGECILPLIGIYGPNSGGKSTVLNALSCLSSLVTASVTVPTRIKDVHCLFSSDCKDIPTQFDVLFRSQGFLFRYQLQFLKGNIAEENLFYGSLGGSDTGILFNRKESVIHPGRELISFSLTVRTSIGNFAVMAQCLYGLHTCQGCLFLVQQNTGQQSQRTAFRYRYAPEAVRYPAGFGT